MSSLGMILTRKKCRFRVKPVPALHYLPQIWHGLLCKRTRVTTSSTVCFSKVELENEDITIEFYLETLMRPLWRPMCRQDIIRLGIKEIALEKLDWFQCSVALMIFSHTVYFIKIFYKFYTFNVIWKHKAAYILLHFNTKNVLSR